MGNSKSVKIIAAIILAAIILVLPYFAGEYYTTLAIKIYVMALLACSFNLLLGYTGILSFGQAAYFGIGAYTCALVLKGAVPSIWVGMLAGMAISGLIAFVFGALCLKLTESGHTVYFAMLTLAFGQIVYTLAFKWDSVTGGDNGLAGIPSPTINLGLFTVNLENVFHFYFFAIVIIALALLVLYRLVHSSFGATLQAIRENHERAKFMGQNIRTFQVISFTVAGIFCGLAGAIFVAIEKFVSPELVYWSKSAEIVMVSILGGIYTFVGPLVGAAVMLLIEDYLSSYTSYWSVFLGSVIIIFVLFMPDGIVGQLGKLKDKYSKTQVRTQACGPGGQ